MFSSKNYIECIVYMCINHFRGGRGKPVERQVSVDGVYTNHRLLQSFGALVGLNVHVSR